jgi:hypothetical protein
MQITQTGFLIPDLKKLNQYREEFRENNCVYIPELIEKKILAKTLVHIQNAEFYENTHLSPSGNVFAKDQTIVNNSIALHQIHFLMNNPSLFSAIRYISNCGEIKGFSGRIYRNSPNSFHHLDWHDDMQIANRLLGVSVNLSMDRYEGGYFQIRKKNTSFLLKEVGCGNLGDTHIFNISNFLEHRVTKTEGLYPRIAAAGWFNAESEFSETIKKGNKNNEY